MVFYSHLKITARCKTKTKKSRKYWLSEDNACRGLSEIPLFVMLLFDLDVLVVEAKCPHYISSLGSSTIKTEECFTFQIHLRHLRDMPKWVKWTLLDKLKVSLPVVINPALLCSGECNSWNHQVFYSHTCQNYLYLSLR